MQTKATILERLNNYRESVAALNMLKVELATFQSITAEEAIEDLTFHHEMGDCVQASVCSDRTAKAAMTYNNVCSRLNTEAKSGIADRLIALQREIQLLETAVAGLPAKERDVLMGFYFERKAISQLAGELMVAERTVRKYREDALSRLVTIYNRYNQLTQGGKTTSA